MLDASDVAFSATASLMKEKMPTDLTGQIFKPVDFDDLGGVAREVHLWAAEDLDLGRCSACPAK